MAPHGTPGASLACLPVSPSPGTACVQVCSAPSTARTSGGAAHRSTQASLPPEIPWELQQKSPSALQLWQPPCHTQAVHHQHGNSRGSHHPCPTLRVWKQLMHKVPGNGAKNMLHVCSVEHAMLSTLFQWESSNQPLQKVGFFFFSPCIYFNIPNRATGKGWVLPYPPAGPVFPAPSLLLIGFATFGYFETHLNFQTHVYSKRLESTDPKPRKANRHNSNCNVILTPTILIKHLDWR